MRARWQLARGSTARCHPDGRMRRPGHQRADRVERFAENGLGCSRWVTAVLWWHGQPAGGRCGRQADRPPAADVVFAAAATVSLSSGWFGRRRIQRLAADTLRPDRGNQRQQSYRCIKLPSFHGLPFDLFSGSCRHLLVEILTTLFKNFKKWPVTFGLSSHTLPTADSFPSFKIKLNKKKIKLKTVVVVRSILEISFWFNYTNNYVCECTCVYVYIGVVMSTCEPLQKKNRKP